MQTYGLTRDRLHHLYHVERLTQAEIAERCGTKQSCISRLMLRWEIPRVGKSDRLGLPPLTVRQIDILIGSRLGDGCLAATGRNTARFQEGHSIKQAEYTRWKAREFEPFTASVYPTEKVLGSRVFRGLGFVTHGCRQFREYRDLFYPEGVRVFPQELPDLMSPLALAVWYMDDGSLANRFHPRISFGLDGESLRRAREALLAFGLTSTVHGGTSIEFPGQSEPFFDLVRDHVISVPDMGYKMPEESARRVADRNAGELSHAKAQELREAGQSVREIAELFGVGVSTVRRRLRGSQKAKMGRPRGQKRKLDGLTREELVRLCAEMTDRAVADRFGVSDTLIRRCRKKWGVRR